MNRTVLLLPLLLVPLGCSLCAAPLFQTVPLAGDPDGLGKLAGRWFDEEGNLIATISSRPEPQLSVRTPYNLEPKDAHLRNGKIVFRLASDDPEEVSLELTGEDELQVSVTREEPGLDLSSACSCVTADRLTAIVLLREPSPAWHMKQSLRKGTAEAAQFARAAYDAALDRLARTL